MRRLRFGLLRVRSPLLAQSLVCFLFLRVLRCFSSPGSPLAWPGAGLAPGGLPHSEIRASTGICPYARLIAACHVLHRLREPRHPSCALLSFPFYFAGSHLFSIPRSPALIFSPATCAAGGEIALFELLLSFSATGLETGRRFHHVNVLLFR